MTGKASAAGAGPLRVHRVIARLNVGGPAMHVVNLARALDGLDEGRRFTTTLVAGTVPPEEGDMEYYARERGVGVTRIPTLSRAVSPLDDARALARLVRLFRRDRPHVVHTHTAKAGALGRIAAAITRVPVRVHTFHGHVLGGDYFSPPVTAFYREVERQLARLTDRLVVLTRSQRDELAELGVADAGRFRVIPLGLELGPFREVDRGGERERVRDELGIGRDERVVGIVGRLAPIKNHELLLASVARLVHGGGEPESGSGIRAVVVGGGERKEELARLADRLGIADRVLWLGWRDDLPRLYAAMDVLALTSHDEGTPVAIIEALAAGTPVVARAVGGVPRILEDGELGRLVPSPEPEAFARALAGALEDPRAPTAEERDRVVRSYSVERLAGDVAGLYEEELRRKGV